MAGCMVWTGIATKEPNIEVLAIEMHTSPVKLNLTLGSDDNVGMLRFFESKSVNGQQIYEGPNFYIIEEEWYKLLPYLTLFVLITRVLPVIFLMLFLKFTTQETYVLCFTTSVILVINEANQMRILGFLEYLSEPMNCLDLVGNICAIIWLQEYNKRCMSEDNLAFFEDKGEPTAVCKNIQTDHQGAYVYAQILWTLSVSVRSSEIFKLKKEFR